MSLEGSQWLAGLEACRLHAYLDSAGVWTIGYGSTEWPDGRPVKKGEKLADKFQAFGLFRRTLAKYEAALVLIVRDDVEQHQFDALCAWLYNTHHPRNFALAAKRGLIRAVNARASLDAIAGRFREWNKVRVIGKGGEPVMLPNGKPAMRVLPGLVARREAEVLAYTRGVYVDQAEAMRRAKGEA